MKKIIALIVALTMAVILAACGGTAQPSTTAAPETTAQIVETVEETTEAVPEVIKPFGDLPAGDYVYVDSDPVVTDEAGQFRFDNKNKTLAWAQGKESGEVQLEGDALALFQEIYYSDAPVTDWLGGALKDTEGYAGAVANGMTFTFNEDGLISTINVTNPGTRVVVPLARDIVADTLTVIGITRGQPNLLQSCITLTGSVNGLYLTKQGDVILTELEIGCNAEGIGLKADKIGGDTFIDDVITVDGKVEWVSLKGVITAFADHPGTLKTNGQDIHMTGGSNVGRVGRALNISTGEGGGDIIIGDIISCDSTRGGLLPTADTSNDNLAIGTSGSITAGEGDVIIGPNADKILYVDVVGDIQGNNVTICPVNNATGAATDVSVMIGNIDAKGDINIVVGNIYDGTTTANVTQSSSVGEVTSTGNSDVAFVVPANPIGNLTAGGDINVQIGYIGGGIGNITAKGAVKVTIAGAVSAGEITGSSVEQNITLY